MWNYLYLSELLSRTSEQPQLELTLDAVHNGTAIVWHHVNLQGEYDVEQLMSGSESCFDWSYLDQFTLANSWKIRAIEPYSISGPLWYLQPYL